MDTVILGCTHYPLIAPMLQRMLGPAVTLVSSGAALARQVEHALSTRGLRNPRAGEGDYRFLCTGDAEAFREQGTRFCRCRSARSSRCGSRLAEAASAERGRERAARSYDRAPTGCARWRSSRASCAPRPARR